MSRLYQPYYHPRRNNNNHTKLQYDDVSDTPVELYDGYYEMQQQPSMQYNYAAFRSRVPRPDIRKRASVSMTHTPPPVPNVYRAGGLLETDGASSQPSPPPPPQPQQSCAFTNLISALGNMEFTMSYSTLLQYLTYSLCVFLLIIWLFPENIIFVLLTIMLLALCIIRYALHVRETHHNKVVEANSTRTYNFSKLEKLRMQMQKQLETRESRHRTPPPPQAATASSKMHRKNSSDSSAAGDRRAKNDILATADVAADNTPATEAGTNTNSNDNNNNSDSAANNNTIAKTVVTEADEEYTDGNKN